MTNNIFNLFPHIPPVSDSKSSREAKEREQENIRDDKFKRMIRDRDREHQQKKSEAAVPKSVPTNLFELSKKSKPKAKHEFHADKSSSKTSRDPLDPFDPYEAAREESGEFDSLHEKMSEADIEKQLEESGVERTVAEEAEAQQVEESLVASEESPEFEAPMMNTKENDIPPENRTALKDIPKETLGKPLIKKMPSVKSDTTEQKNANQMPPSEAMRKPPALAQDKTRLPPAQAKKPAISQSSSQEHLQAIKDTAPKAAEQKKALLPKNKTSPTKPKSVLSNDLQPPVEIPRKSVHVQKDQAQSPSELLEAQKQEAANIQTKKMEDQQLKTRLAQGQHIDHRVSGRTGEIVNKQEPSQSESKSKKEKDTRIQKRAGEEQISSQPIGLESIHSRTELADKATFDSTVNISELISQIVEHIRVMEKSNETHLIVTLKNPPLFAGATLTLVGSEHAKAEFTLSFANLTPQAKTFLDQKIKEDSLPEKLRDKGIIIHMIHTTTEAEIPTPKAFNPISKQQQQEKEEE